MELFYARLCVVEGFFIRNGAGSCWRVFVDLNFTLPPRFDFPWFVCRHSESWLAIVTALVKCQLINTESLIMHLIDLHIVVHYRLNFCFRKIISAFCMHSTSHMLLFCYCIFAYIRPKRSKSECLQVVLNCTCWNGF